MTTKQLTEFDHPAAWTVEGLLAQTDKWVYELTEDDLAELDTAFRQVKSKGLVAPFFSKDDFPISNLAAMIEEHREELEFGLGIFNIVGFHDPRLPDQCRNGPAHR